MNVLRPNFEKRDGLITVIAQDVNTRQVLMVAYTNEAGYRETLATGKAVYWSTSRNKRWLKGEESGDIQLVKNVLIDCDGDAVIFMVEQKGPGACHTKAPTCFYRTVRHENNQFHLAPSAGAKENLPSMDTPVSSDIYGLSVEYTFVTNTPA